MNTEPGTEAAATKKRRLGSGGIRTHAPEETGALIQRLRPLGHATQLWLTSSRELLNTFICNCSSLLWEFVSYVLYLIPTELFKNMPGTKKKNICSNI